eukprot:CAMPEP_0198546422 /NCGR_PEP_ID=MMETSP1462-20131121/67006_1 /TAXON_ID=1333877 /ORGANISM="Brandtodinium nutriculum, Strain RCC3387" /LENGTH=107 /DNA_ID=CAMNT_0044276867 /DNA_START=144 /DNA_END=465 /DNA_ORIENTATION=+
MTAGWRVYVPRSFILPVEDTKDLLHRRQHVQHISIPTAHRLPVDRRKPGAKTTSIAKHIMSTGQATSRSTWFRAEAMHRPDAAPCGVEPPKESHHVGRGVNTGRASS